MPQGKRKEKESWVTKMENASHLLSWGAGATLVPIPSLECYQKEKCLRGKGWPHCFGVFEDHFPVEQWRTDRWKILGKKTFENKQEDGWNGNTVPVQKCCGLKPRRSRGFLLLLPTAQQTVPLLSLRTERRTLEKSLIIFNFSCHQKWWQPLKCGWLPGRRRKKLKL